MVFKLNNFNKIVNIITNLDIFKQNICIGFLCLFTIIISEDLCTFIPLNLEHLKFYY